MTPVPPEVQEQLLRQASAQKRGERQTFGAGGGQQPQIDWSDVRAAHRATVSGEEKAQRLVELETVFAQQAQALASNLRAMLSILGHLQQARMDVFGQGPTAAERAFSAQASTFGVGPDGFFRNESTHSPNDAPQTKNDGGSDGNVSG
jgi:hypothetical protein